MQWRYKFYQPEPLLAAVRQSSVPDSLPPQQVEIVVVTLIKRVYIPVIAQLHGTVWRCGVYANQINGYRYSGIILSTRGHGTVPRMVRVRLEIGDTGGFR